MNGFIIGFLVGSIVTEILMIIYYGSHDEEETMKIKHTYIDNKIVIMIEPKDAQEEREIIKRIEFAELCAEQPKKKDEEKER